MPNSVGNGPITAIDLKTGKIKWVHKTDFPTWVSPLATNGVSSQAPSRQQASLTNIVPLEDLQTRL